MFTLTPDQKEQAINLLVEGTSLRATTRLTGISRTTLHRLLLRVGEGSALLMDQSMRNLPCTKFQLDEIWA